MNFIVYIFGIPTSLTDRKVGWCVMLLIDIILKAQEGNNEASLILIGQFNPLLRKYAYKLSYDDAYNDLLVDFLEIIKSIDINNLHNNCDGSIVSYICKSVYTSYIGKSKAKHKYFQFVTPFSGLSENEKYYAEVSLASYDNYNILLTLSLNKILNQQEFLVIYTIYFLGYSSADIAQASGISRQAVNQTKVRALKKLRNALSV